MAMVYEITLNYYQFREIKPNFVQNFDFREIPKVTFVNTLITLLDYRTMAIELYQTIGISNIVLAKSRNYIGLSDIGLIKTIGCPPLVKSLSILFINVGNYSIAEERRA